jgi:curved DNA-binding protein
MSNIPASGDAQRKPCHYCAKEPHLQVSPDEPDHYSILGVLPDCDAKQLEIAYKALAKKYHPDHSETADLDRFKEITGAYRVLRDPLKRFEYDEANRHLFRAPTGASGQVGGFDQATVANDALVHETILMHLYNLRRQSTGSSGAGEWQLLDLVGCSEKNLEFHTWYLKEKGFIMKTEEGTWAITIAGVDHTIETMRSRQDTIRLLTQRRERDFDGDAEIDDAL